MSLAPNVRHLLEGHIGLELESIDFTSTVTSECAPIGSNAPLNKALQTIDTELDRLVAQAFLARKAA